MQSHGITIFEPTGSLSARTQTDLAAARNPHGFGAVVYSRTPSQTRSPVSFLIVSPQRSFEAQRCSTTGENFWWGPFFDCERGRRTRLPHPSVHDETVLNGSRSASARRTRSAAALCCPGELPPGAAKAVRPGHFCDLTRTVAWWGIWHGPVACYT